MRKAEKGQVIAELESMLAPQPHIIITGYRGMKVKHGEAILSWL